MAENERTQPDIASEAARILAMSDEEIADLARCNPGTIRSVVASALTQTRDQPK